MQDGFHICDVDGTAIARKCTNQFASNQEEAMLFDNLKLMADGPRMLELLRQSYGELGDSDQKLLSSIHAMIAKHTKEATDSK